MDCPVCGGDCIRPANEILDVLSDIFSPCPACRMHIHDKAVPPADRAVLPPCTCGRRFIDDVFVHLYSILDDEGDLPQKSPLAAAGIPLVHPGFAMRGPPFLPERSLVLLSRYVSGRSAHRIVDEVPECRGVVRSGDFVPGVTGADPNATARTYELLAGCDVRADVFSTLTSSVVVYKQQSAMHIEFPRVHSPKIAAVSERISRALPRVFVDACSGAGTLGLVAALDGVRRVIQNDCYFAAAFWTACNLEVNRENLLVDSVKMFESYDARRMNQGCSDPRKIAEATGAQQIEVYQGDWRRLGQAIPKEKRLLAVIDLFEKGEPARMRRIEREWRERIGGEVFIP